jgi:hypothetical protein
VSGDRRRRLARLERRRGGSAFARAQAIADRYLNPCRLAPAEMRLLIELEKRTSPYWNGGDEPARERWSRLGPAGRIAVWRGACRGPDETARLAGVLGRVPVEDLDRLEGSVLDNML